MPKKKSKKVRISYSSVDAFKECPQKYWNKQTHEMKFQPSAFSFGAAFESGVEKLLKGETLEKAKEVLEKEWHTRPKNKWEEAKQIFDNTDIFFYQSDYEPEILNKEDLKEVDIWFTELVKDQFAEPLQYVEDSLKRLKDGVKLSENDQRLVNRVMWLCCLRRGELMLEAFQREILPEVEEVVVYQDDIALETEDGDAITGYIDFIVKMKNHDEPFIVDLKSAGRPYEEHQLISSDQLGIYALAKNINNIAYWVVLKKVTFDVYCDNCKHLRVNARKTNCENCEKGKYTKRVPKVGTQILKKKIEDHRLQAVESDYSEVMTAIKNKIVWKNPHSCENYGTKCEYYDYCWNGKSLDEIPHLRKK